MNPKVTFIVPCYRLAHLLSQCVQSLLDQTYENFEVLIMDDCSPDETPAVAQGFHDSRVVHIRNATNLGHLRNYNKGIGLAKGEYIWLISADDYLRTNHALARYVDVMDKNPNVGYICCAGVECRNGEETGLAKYTLKASHDTIFRGHSFLKRLLYERNIFAPSVMVRTRCYRTLGEFPLDMPYAGDGYLWGLYALHHDVAFLAEPMVGYRIHDLCITDAFLEEKPQTCVSDDLAVLWRLKRKIEEAGHRQLARECGKALGYEYARLKTGKRYRSRKMQMTLTECDISIRENAKDAREAKRLRAQFRASVGDLEFQNRKIVSAGEAYKLAVREYPWMPKAWIKLLLLRFGHLGSVARQAGFAFRSVNVGKRKCKSAISGA